MSKKNMWVLEASNNGLITDHVFFCKPTEEQLELVLWGDDFEGKTDAVMYEIETENADYDDVMDYLNANDADDFLNIYVPSHNWKVRQTEEFLLNIQLG